MNSFDIIFAIISVIIFSNSMLVLAPGPIMTPLQNVSRNQDNMDDFLESQTLLSRINTPSEVAACYVFLASNDSSFMTGQALHLNGGEIINS